MIRTTERGAKALQASDDKAALMPLRGVHVGGGRHVDLDASDPGKGGNGAGWTLHRYDVVVETVDEETTVYAYPATAEAVKAVEAAKAKPDRGRTPAEKDLAVTDTKPIADDPIVKEISK